MSYDHIPKTPDFYETPDKWSPDMIGFFTLLATAAKRRLQALARQEAEKAKGDD